MKIVRHKLLLLVALTLMVVSMPVYAQNTSYSFDWEWRALRLNDFATSQAILEKESNLAIQWKIETSKFSVPQKEYCRIKYYDIKNLFIPSDSWIAEDSRNPEKLKFEQLKFDMSELYSRKAENAVNRAGKLGNTINEYKDSLTLAIDVLCEVTQNGEDSLAVDFLSKRVSEEIKALGMPYQDINIPEKMGVAVEVAFYEQGTLRAGNITQLLPSIYPYLGIELSLVTGRMCVAFNLSAQQTGDWLTSNEDFYYKDQFYPKGSRCEDIHYFGLLKYSVFKNNRIQIWPFAGAGVVNMSFLPTLDLKNFSTYNYMAGIDVDYCLRETWTLQNRRLEDCLLKGRIYVSRDDIAGYTGYSINVGAGISIRTRKTR